jgi:hypothetical protein
MKICTVCQATCSEAEGSVCFHCSPVQKCVECDSEFRSLFFADGLCNSCGSPFDNDTGDDCSEYDDEDYPSNLDESMDGDFDSAMTSAGFGTDEDYGYYGDE